ncbi:BRI1 kinase inhibitor 1-like [Mangifera indica]|uniref:BRI1 kinase inhibitor 1-like n=1 Tax=Mangifera indica TaxID=29780 RepID=UPI001CFA51B3|nr:BRI1 kinase inhibitor 1-like [Mangifera indica]
MDTNQHQTTKGKAFDSKQEDLLTKPSPTSASSSPSHEFSFTISLHSSSAPILDKTKPPPSIAIDLSPADDIFFHGHLLPLHLLSHLPVSPRSSSNSLDSFTLPTRDLIDDQKSDKSFSNSISNRNSNNISNNGNCNHEADDNESKGRTKSNKSFALFGFPRWRKGSYQVTEGEDKEKQKKKMRFDVSNVIKRYARMVRPLLFFKGRRENLHFHSQPCSFSASFRNKQELRGRRGLFSAPASIRTSPKNSGLLVATTTLTSSTSDSTMEELQAAIQAAIAHCKNSIAEEDKLHC